MARRLIASESHTDASNWLQAFVGRRVFVTGHTGFVGSWTSLWLHLLGAEVAGYALPPDEGQVALHSAINPQSVFQLSTYGDVADHAQLKSSIREFEPEFIIHLAAQPIVRRSYTEPRQTFETNVMGTINVLDAVREQPNVRACLVITSDKCYENLELPRPYKESDRIGGRDPYSASKGAAELATSSYYRSFFYDSGTGCATARAGNIIGGGDFGADRLIPDLIRAVHGGRPLEVRNSESVRPWQHVLESVSGYLVLTAALSTDTRRFSGGWNFGPGAGDAITVRALVEEATTQFGGRLAATWDARSQSPHEAQLLNLDYSKAREELGWEPILDIAARLRSTFEWYMSSADGDVDLERLTRTQILDFQTLLADIRK